MSLKPLTVFPTHARDPGRGFGSLFRDLAHRDRFGVHRLTEDATTADIIVFLDLNEMADDVSLYELRHHPLVLQYPERCLVYCESDQPWCAMQGLYVSMPRGSFQVGRQKACSYIAQTMNGRLDLAASRAIVPDLLYSFMGRVGNSSRDSVFALRHARGVVRDTTRTNFFSTVSTESEALRKEFATTVYRSKFVLCPRGFGTSSYRIFEAMQAARVPVIISDNWVRIEGPDWDKFAVFCDERDVANLPNRLENMEGSAEQKGHLAREAWEQWFAPEALFHRMTEACASIICQRRFSERLTRYRPSLTLWRLRARAWKFATSQRLASIRN